MRTAVRGGIKKNCFFSSEKLRKGGGGTSPNPKFPYQKKLGHSELLVSEFRSFSEKKTVFFYASPYIWNMCLKTSFPGGYWQSMKEDYSETQKKTNFQMKRGEDK